MLPLLLACSPDALLAPPLDVADLITDAALVDLPERAWLDDAASVTVAGQHLVDDRVEPMGALPVIEVLDDGLRLAIDYRMVRLVVDVDAAQLRPVLFEQTLATPDPDGGWPGVGLVLPAGTPVDPDLSFHGAVPVDVDTDWLTGQGWVPTEAAAGFAAMEEPPLSWSGSRLIDAETVLRDGPDGEGFATLLEDTWVLEEGAPEDGWQRVSITRPEVTATGYVPAIPQDGLRGLASAGRGLSISTHCGMGSWWIGDPLVPEGTVLLADPGGPAVGVATGTFDTAILDREDEFLLIEVDSPWGPVEVWIE